MGGGRVGGVVPTRVALLFGYDGTAFDGYARQPDPVLYTVEDALMDALVMSGAAPDRESLAWRTGSRTDKGVSARENVVAFTVDAPAERVPLAVGGRIEGLWPVAAAAVDESFDPRRAAGREYRYFLSGRWTRGERRRLEETLSVFVGTHDFSSFAKREEGRDPVRRIHAVAVDDGPDGLVLRVRGGSFLRQQVRRMVAGVLAVVEGRLPPGALEEALVGAPLDLEPAPPEPLVLWQVDDPRVRFRRSEEGWSRLGPKRLAARSGAWARWALYEGLGEDLGD